MVVGIRSKGEAERTDRLLHALADPTRRDIVRVVLRSEHSVSDLARRYTMSFAAVQKHVVVLERAELVTKHQRGRERMVRGEIDSLRAVNRLLDEFETVWRNRLQRFGDVLAESETGRPEAHHPEPLAPTHRSTPTQGEGPWPSLKSSRIQPPAR